MCSVYTVATERACIYSNTNESNVNKTVLFLIYKFFIFPAFINIFVCTAMWVVNTRRIARGRSKIS